MTQQEARRLKIGDLVLRHGMEGVAIEFRDRIRLNNGGEDSPIRWRQIRVRWNIFWRTWVDADDLWRVETVPSIPVAGKEKI